MEPEMKNNNKKKIILIAVVASVIALVILTSVAAVLDTEEIRVRKEQIQEQITEKTSAWEQSLYEIILGDGYLQAGGDAVYDAEVTGGPE